MAADDKTGSPSIPRPTTYRLEGKGLPYLIAFSSAIDNLVKKPKEVCEVNPKSTIEAASVDSLVDEGIVAFHHHEASALQTLHTCLTLVRLSQTVHD